MFKKTIILTFLLLGGLFAQPDWFLKPSDSEYSSDAWFMAVAVSQQSYDHAVNIASASIAKQLKSYVKAKSTMRTDSYMYEGGETITEKYGESSLVYSDLELKGIEVAKQEQRKGDYYVMVVLNKARFAEILRADLARINEDISILKGDAEKSYAAGRVADAVAGLLKVNKLIAKGDNKLDVLSAVSPLGPNDRLAVSKTEIQSLIKEYILSVKLTAVSPSDLQVKAGEKIGPLQVKMEDANGNPLKNMPVGFYRHRRDRKPMVKFTDASGVAEARLPFPDNNDAEPEIVAKPMFPFAGKQVRRVLEQMAVTFNVTVERPQPKELFLDVEFAEMRPDAAEAIAQKLRKMLERNGLIVTLKKRPQRLYVRLSGEKLADITSMKRLVKVKAEAEYVLYEGKKPVLNFSRTAKGVGSNEVKAFRKAAGSLQPKASDIKAIYDRLAGPRADEKKVTMAVISIAYNQRVTNYYHNVSGVFHDMLTSALYETGEFDVVERARLNSIMSEINLSQTENVSRESALKIGKLLGAKYVVIGTISSLAENHIEIDCKKIETETAKIKGTAHTVIESFDMLRSAADDIAAQLLEY